MINQNIEIEIKLKVVILKINYVSYKKLKIAKTESYVRVSIS